MLSARGVWAERASVGRQSCPSRNVQGDYSVKCGSVKSAARAIVRLLLSFAEIFPFEAEGQLYHLPDSLAS